MKKLNYALSLLLFAALVGTASLDPVALDKFCIDQVFSIPTGDGNDTKALIERINQRHGIRILYRAEENGLGSTSYKVVEL